MPQPIVSVWVCVKVGLGVSAVVKGVVCGWYGELVLCALIEDGGIRWLCVYRVAQRIQRGGV